MEWMILLDRVERVCARETFWALTYSMNRCNQIPVGVNGMSSLEQRALIPAGHAHHTDPKTCGNCVGSSQTTDFCLGCTCFNFSIQANVDVSSVSDSSMGSFNWICKPYRGVLLTTDIYQTVLTEHWPDLLCFLIPLVCWDESFGGLNSSTTTRLRSERMDFIYFHCPSFHFGWQSALRNPDPVEAPASVSKRREGLIVASRNPPNPNLLIKLSPF